MQNQAVEATMTGSINTISFDQAVDILSNSKVLKSTDLGNAMAHQIKNPDGSSILLVVGCSGTSFKYTH